jgi:serine/threonine protein kinase
MHSKGRFYFDVKPENILIVPGYDGEVHVAIGNLGRNRISSYVCPLVGDRKTTWPDIQWLGILLFASLRRLRWVDEVHNHVIDHDGENTPVAIPQNILEEIQQSISDMKMSTMNTWFIKYIDKLQSGVTWRRRWTSKELVLGTVFHVKPGAPRLPPPPPSPSINQPGEGTLPKEPRTSPSINQPGEGTLPKEPRTSSTNQPGEGTLPKEPRTSSTNQPGEGTLPNDPSRLPCIFRLPDTPVNSLPLRVKCGDIQVQTYVKIMLQALPLRPSHKTLDIQFEYEQAFTWRCGSYGVVLIYRAEINGEQRLFALKFHKDPEEYKAVNTLRGIECGQIDAQCLDVHSSGLFKVDASFSDSPSSYLTIMPKYTGSLYGLSHYPGEFADHQDRLNRALCRQITKRVHEMVSCLHKKGQFYLDVKPDNVLYLQNNEHLSVTLGDLGSNRISSYYCPIEQDTKTQDTVQFLAVILYARLRLYRWPQYLQDYIRGSHRSQVAVPNRLLTAIQESVQEYNVESVLDWFGSYGTKLRSGVRWTKNWEGARLSYE